MEIGGKGLHGECVDSELPSISIGEFLLRHLLGKDCNGSRMDLKTHSLLLQYKKLAWFTTSGGNCEEQLCIDPILSTFVC